MKIAAILLFASLLLAASTPSDHPVYAGNTLQRPDNYRDWVFLSSGYGMAYGTVAGHEQFTNVFVPQWAYREFTRTGKWPDQTMFVVEEREAASRGSINKSGHYQSDLAGIGVEVKDSRFPDKWAYYNFGPGDQQNPPNPKQACWQCHEDHASVEHTFVQFYPTLIPAAKKFGVYRER